MDVERKGKKLKSMQVQYIFKPSLKKQKHKSAILTKQLIESDALNNQIITLLIQDLLKQAQNESDYRQQAIIRVNSLLKSHDQLLSNMLQYQNLDESEILCIADEQPQSDYRPTVIKEEHQNKKIRKRPSRFRQFSILKASSSFYTQHEHQDELAQQQIEVQKKEKDNIISKLKKEYLSVIQNKIEKEPVQIIADYRPQFSIQQSEEIGIFRKNIFKNKRLSKLNSPSLYVKSSLQSNLITNTVSSILPKNSREYLEKIDSTMNNISEIKENNRNHLHPRHSSLHNDLNSEEGIKMKHSDLKQITNFAKPIKQIIQNRRKDSFSVKHNPSGQSFLARTKTQSKQNLQDKIDKSFNLPKRITQPKSSSKNSSISVLPKISKR